MDEKLAKEIAKMGNITVVAQKQTTSLFPYMFVLTVLLLIGKTSGLLNIGYMWALLPLWLLPAIYLAIVGVVIGAMIVGGIVFLGAMAWDAWRNR